MDLYTIFPGLPEIINHLFEILVVVLLIWANLLLLGISDKMKRVERATDSANHDLSRIESHLDAIARDQRLAQAGLLPRGRA